MPHNGELDIIIYLSILDIMRFGDIDLAGKLKIADLCYHSPKPHQSTSLHWTKFRPTKCNVKILVMCNFLRVPAPASTSVLAPAPAPAPAPASALVCSCPFQSVALCNLTYLIFYLVLVYCIRYFLILTCFNFRIL